jgi:hypothetical protein
LPDEPEQIALWLEVLTGLKLDAAQGSVRVIDNGAWRAARDRLMRMGGSVRRGAG